MSAAELPHNRGMDMSWDFAAYEYALSALIVVTTMVGMGTQLRFLDFYRVVRYPQAVVLTIGIQLLVTPVVALSLAWLLRLPEGLGFGLLFVTALPGGAYSNLLTYLGRGNNALSITATAMATLACPLTTVLVLTIYGAVQLPESLEIPAWPIFRDMLLFMGLPLLTGMIIRRVSPKWWPLVARSGIRTSMALLAVYVIGASFAGRVGMGSFSWQALLATILLAVASLWIGYGLGYCLKLPVPDLFTVAIEVIFRNVQLGLLIKASIFADASQKSAISDAVLFVLLCYGAVALGVGGIEVVAHRRGFGLMYRKKSAAR